MKSTAARIRLVAMAAALALGMTGIASATLTDISSTPLSSSSSNLVKPNISYVLDTSGSMAWTHAPDESQPWFNNVGYKTSQCNSIYYNPTIIYPPPRNFDGTAFANASFTGAWVNGFNTGAGTVNLSTGYYAYDNITSFGAGIDPNNPASNGDIAANAGKAYYYNYLGTQQATGLNYQNTGSQFYKECNASESPTPNASITFAGTSNTSVTSFTVNGTNIMSGPTVASTSSTTVASRLAANITAAGYTATVSGSTVTISGPLSVAGVVPVITTSPPIPNATITFSGTATTSVTGILVNGIQLLASPSTPSGNSITEAANTAAAITLNGFSATASGSVVTIAGPFAAAGFTPVVTVAGNQSATITFSGTVNTAVSAVTVNGTNILGGTTAASTSSTTVATRVAAAVTASGFSATASGSTVTITGPNSATGFTPVVTAVPGASTATITFSGNNNTSVSSVTTPAGTITNGATGTTNNTTNMATNVAGKITLLGFSASSSGAVVTITGPLSALGTTPSVNKTGSMAAAVTSFTGAAMTSSSTSFTTNGTMTAAVTAFPPPGTMTATIVAFSPFVKVLVGATSGPGGTDERQNFANWFSYYRTRILMMKSGLGRAFVSIGNNYRVGFMTIYTTPSSSTTDPGYLSINDFNTTPGGQKAQWYAKVYAQSPGGGTPLKTALSTAARNIAGKIGPDPVQYSCQQNFILLSTDGYWNAGTPNGTQLDGVTAIGNQDNTLSTAPRPQYDGGLAGSTNTLADVAWYYYNTDLKPSSGPCNTGVAGADVCTDNVPVSGLDNNPKQHVTLFTLGLGTNGQLRYDTAYLTGGSADFNAIVGGSNWPTPVGDTLTTIDDLWHAAVNGHGQYFSAKNPDLLVSGLQTALAGVSAHLAAGAAAATSNLQPVAGDNVAFVGSYTTKEWTGEIQARTIDLTSGAISATSSWSGQALLDATTTDVSDTRNIFTFLNGVKTDFLPASFTAAQKSSWFTPGNSPVLSQFAGWSGGQSSAATPDTVINYLRGQFGFEERGSNPSNNQLYRVRSHVLGDIIDATPVYVKLPPFNYVDSGYAAFKTSSAVTSRPGTVYVGANDGMLHAFDATTGQEDWAYIPSFVLPNLKALANDSYPNSHQFYVDGSPVAGDIFNGSAWRTILVGGLNAGGKGYYALDITDPTTPAILWEFSDSNLGFTFGNPVIGKLTDGTWVVVVSSGYNNVGDGVGRLYVLNAFTGALRFSVSTGVGNTATPSGLGKIAGWVDNGLLDNTIQRVYGGDMLGNLWRFDVDNIIAPAGIEATQLALFQIPGTPPVSQPITTQPELGLVNNKPVIFVGTGRYLGASDLSDLSQQSLYAVVDNLAATGIGNARTETTCPLVHQALTVIDVNTRSTTALPVNLATACGWYLDFNPTGGNTPGERVNVDPKLQLGVLAVATNIPDSSVCTVGGSSFLYFFDFSTGQSVTTSTGAVAGQRIGNAVTVGIDIIQLPGPPPGATGPGTCTTCSQGGGKVVTSVTTSDDQHPVFGNPSNLNAGVTGKRVGWRELLN